MNLFDGYPVLESDRLIIKKMTLHDAEVLEALTKESAVYSYLPVSLFICVWFVTLLYAPLC